MSSKSKIIAVVVTFALLATVAIYIYSQSQDDEATPSTSTSTSTSTTTSSSTSTTAVIDGDDGIKEILGTVTDIDSSQAPVDGPTVYKVKTENEKVVKVSVPSGQVLCDQMAIDISEGIVVGSEVRARGIENKDGSLTVCAKGTFLRP